MILTFDCYSFYQQQSLWSSLTLGMKKEDREIQYKTRRDLAGRGMKALLSPSRASALILVSARHVTSSSVKGEGEKNEVLGKRTGKGEGSGVSK